MGTSASMDYLLPLLALSESLLDEEPGGGGAFGLAEISDTSSLAADDKDLDGYWVSPRRDAGDQRLP